MDAKKYIKILQDKMLPCLKGLGRRSLFNMTMIPSILLRPLLLSWNRKWSKCWNSAVCHLIWTLMNTCGVCWKGRLSSIVFQILRLWQKSFSRDGTPFMLHAVCEDILTIPITEGFQRRYEAKCRHNKYLMYPFMLFWIVIFLYSNHWNQRYINYI